MPVISFSITDTEAAAVLEITRESAQSFIERNARIHVADCVQNRKAKELSAAGLPVQLITCGFDDDELEAIKTKRTAKIAAANAVKEAARVKAEVDAAKVKEVAEEPV